MTIDWGDIPTWVSAGGSVFALIFAAGAVLIAWRTHQIESERDRVSAESNRAQELYMRRAQAALVSAWWGQHQDGRLGAFLRNASETPVYQVYITVLGPDDHVDSMKAHYLVVPPAQDALFCEIEVGPGGDGLRQRRVKVSFTDAAGVRWSRNQYGRLTELAPNLRIRADLDRGGVLAGFKDDFKETYGVNVEFDADPHFYPQRRFMSDVQRESLPPDAFICPHDWIGDLIDREIIEPTILSASHLGRFPDWALSALTVDGKLYGLPTTLDTIALIRNTDLAPELPETFDELLATAEELREAGRVTELLVVRVGERGDPFQIWPLFTSAGGWLFDHPANGHWDEGRIGLATPESICAFERLRALGEHGRGVLRRSIGREEAFDLFTTGQSPYLLSTSDALRYVRHAGIPAAVTAVPPFAGGHPATAFTLVHMLAMTRRGPNKAIAHDLFADYLSHEHVITAIMHGVDAPAALQGMSTSDVAVQQFLSLCELGEPMPTFPQMDDIWRILEEAEVAVISGESAELTARRAAARVEACFEARRRTVHA